MTSRISLQVDFEGRKFYLTPISIEIDLKEYVKRSDREDFEIKIVDEATGKTIPCQFSPSENESLKGKLSWIHPSYAHEKLEVIIGSDVLKGYNLQEEVKIWDRGDYQLEVFVNGMHVTNYIYNDAYERPFLYPVIGPDGLSVVRHIPNFGDHPHHKGINIALGDVSGKRGEPGINFWALGNIGDPRHGRVIHQRFRKIEEGPVFGLIEAENVWKQNDELEEPTYNRIRWKIKSKGRILMKERRTITVWNVSPMRIIDIHTVMEPLTDEIILSADVEGKGTAKENGPLVIRVADCMRETSGGRIVNSEGKMTEKECWGRPARWVDYYGPVKEGGPINGIAAMDHPENIRHPTGWHVRGYGLFAANPFYDKKPEWPDQGPIYLSKARGDRFDMRYRIYIHRGDPWLGRVEERWQEWTNPPKVEIQ